MHVVQLNTPGYEHSLHDNGQAMHLLGKVPFNANPAEHARQSVALFTTHATQFEGQAAPVITHI